MNKLAVVTLAALVLAGASARADNVTMFEMINQVTIDSTEYNVWVMLFSGTEDWTNSRLDIDLTSGSMYQDALGGDTPPNPLFFPAFPNLEWDTFAYAPGDTAPSFAEANLSESGFHASWFDTASTGTGPHKLAQITLSSDANGSLTGRSYDAGTAGVGVAIEGFAIVNGMIVPEPTTLVLLGLGGLSTLIRRRRR